MTSPPSIREPANPWEADDLTDALLPFLAKYEELPFSTETRCHPWTKTERTAERHYSSW